MVNQKDMTFSSIWQIQPGMVVTPIILTTWEAEIRRIAFEANLDGKRS
jgi:hypothetical protein